MLPKKKGKVCTHRHFLFLYFFPPTFTWSYEMSQVTLSLRQRDAAWDCGEACQTLVYSQLKI